MGYSYGEEHDAWKEYAKAVGESAADLLSADVGVSEYGDKDNSDLAERFGEKTEEFLRFAHEKAGAWIGLPGQIKELDELAKELVESADKAAVIKKAEAAAANSNEETAKYYVKVMQKLGADAEFVTKEGTRLKRMMDDASVKASKKEQFGRRLNVLSSF